MKLVINFDFFDAVLNVNEDINYFKVIRNNKKRLAFITPFWFSLVYWSQRRVSESILTTILINLFCIGKITFDQKMKGLDFYKVKSSNDLKRLVINLKECLYLNTNYDLLKESELISKKYKITYFSENSLSIIEKKYILVPTIDFSGNIKNVSLLQEHSIGSNEYVLSFGSPKKEMKLAYSNI